MLGITDANLNLWHLILSLALMKYTPFSSYTSYNCLLWVGAWLLKLKSLWPVIFTNTLAISTTFYTTGSLIDRSFYTRMMLAHGIPRALFVVGDLLLHFGPSVYMLFSLFYRSEEWRDIGFNNREVYKYSGLYSACLNLLYGALNGFEPNSVYVPLNEGKWWSIWICTTFYHFLYSKLLNIPTQVMYVPIP